MPDSAVGIWPSGCDVVIVGAGGFGREVLGIAYDLGSDSRILGFADDDSSKEGAVLDGKDVLGPIETLSSRTPGGAHFVVAVGDPMARAGLVKRARRHGLLPAVLVSPTAVVSQFTRIERGCILCAMCIVNSQVKVGAYTIINLASTVGHDATLGAFTTLAPGVHVSGYARIGSLCDLGTGAIVNPGIEVGRRSVVGSGATVVRSIPAGMVAVGTPAKPIRRCHIPNVRHSVDPAFGL